MKKSSWRPNRLPSVTAPTSDESSSKRSSRYVLVAALASIAIGAGIAWQYHATTNQKPPVVEVAPTEDVAMTNSSGRPLDDAFKQAVQAQARRAQEAAAAR